MDPVDFSKYIAAYYRAIYAKMVEGRFELPDFGKGMLTGLNGVIARFDLVYTALD